MKSSHKGPTLSLEVNPGDGGTAFVTFRSYYSSMGGYAGDNTAGILNVTTIGTLGTDAKVLFANAPSLVNNVLAGAFVHGTDIATYDATPGGAGVIPFNTVGGGGVAYVAAASAGVTDTAYLNGNFTLAADKQWNALKMDGAVEIDLNGNTLALGKSGNTTDGLGVMVVKTGAGEAVIKGTTAAKYLTAAATGQAAHYAFMVNEGVLKVTAPLKGGNTAGPLVLRLNKMGSGVLWLDPAQPWLNAGPYTGYNSGIYFSDGVIRLNPSDSDFGNETMVLNGGVMEITGGGTYSPTIGQGNANLFWLTSGGFAAYGTNGIQDATFSPDIAWNAANHIPDGAALLLNSTTANSKIILSGILNLGTDAAKMYLREIEVADNPNSANDMAEISGQIISDTTAGGGGTPTYTYHLVKTGAGTLSLSHANNNYSGATYVKAGTLAINGALAAPASSTVAFNPEYSAVNVMSGGTLGGTGTIDRVVRVEAGGTLAPGNSTGILTLDADASLTNGATLAIQINGLTEGTQYDQLKLTDGTLVVSNSTLSLAIASFVKDPGTNYFWIVNNAGSGNTLGEFAGMADNTQVSSANGYQWFITYDAQYGTTALDGGNDILLYMVPEPSAWALVGLGLIGTWLVGRRRRA